MDENEDRRAGRLAYLASAVNLAATSVMPWWLGPGLPLAGSRPEDRMAFVSAHAGSAWRAGWLLWHAAALSLLAFFAGLALIWRRRAPLRCGIAMACASAGLAADLAAEAVYMGLVSSVDPPSFALIESFAGLMTGYLGNGLYTLAGILLTWAGASVVPRSLSLLGSAVWLCGLSLSAATLAGSPGGQLVATACLMPSFVVWSALMGRWLRRGRR